MTPISMKCLQENWDNIKVILDKHRKTYSHITSFDTSPYLVNNIADTDVISNVTADRLETNGRRYYSKWDEKIFLQACGISGSVLPEKYCVRNPWDSRSNLLYDYTNSLKDKGVKGYYPYTGGTYFHFPPYSLEYGEVGITSSNVEPGYTKITFDQFVEHVLKQEDVKDSRFPFKLTENQGKAILAECCPPWRDRFAKLWGKDFLLFGYTHISEDLYNEAMEHSLSPTLKNIVSKTFITYKEGDYITVIRNPTSGTLNGKEGQTYKITEVKDSKFLQYSPYKSINTNIVEVRLATLEEIENFNAYKYTDGELVFVKKENYGLWELRYTTGYLNPNLGLECYNIQDRKSNDKTFWHYHAPALGVKLPE